MARARFTRIACLAALLGLSALVDKSLTGIFFTDTAPRGVKFSTTITVKEVLAAQKAWGDALVALSATYEKEGFEAAKKLASDVIDAAYGYKYGPVNFKPTLAGGSQTFRPTKKGALAYFVGGDSSFPKDTGFGIKGWVKYKFVNTAIYMEGNTAIVQGNAHFTNKDGTVTTVDKTFGYFKTPDGNLVIVLHHSSLPYSK